MAGPRGWGASAEPVGGSPRRVEVLDGIDGGDLMIAYGHNKVVLGRGGNDYIFGTQRTEAVFPGDGDDTAIGWSGDDIMVGNQGRVGARWSRAAGFPSACDA